MAEAEQREGMIVKVGASVQRLPVGSKGVDEESIPPTTAGQQDVERAFRYVSPGAAPAKPPQLAIGVDLSCLDTQPQRHVIRASGGVEPFGKHPVLLQAGAGPERGRTVEQPSPCLSGKGNQIVRQNLYLQRRRVPDARRKNRLVGEFKGMHGR